MLDDREKESVVSDRPEVGLQVVLVDRAVTPRVVLFPIEEFDHHDPSDSLVEISVDARQPHADVAVGVAELRSKEEGGEHHERQNAEGDQREPPVHVEHGAQDEAQCEQVAEYCDDA